MSKTTFQRCYSFNDAKLLHFLSQCRDIPSSTISTQKMLRDGQIIILRGEKKYSIMGQEVR